MKLLLWVQRILVAAGIALLSFCGCALFDQEIHAKKEAALLHETRIAEQVPVASRGLAGLLEIPRLDLSVTVSEGTSDHTLRRAAGHIEGTGLPGKDGNVGIAGHRDTFFRPLRNIRQHDLITLTTSAGVFEYRVVSTRIVTPYEVSVLAPSKIEVLTLVTCYPFHYVGPAPSRFIVRAERLVQDGVQ